MESGLIDWRTGMMKRLIRDVDHNYKRVRLTLAVLQGNLLQGKSTDPYNDVFIKDVLQETIKQLDIGVSTQDISTDDAEYYCNAIAVTIFHLESSKNLHHIWRHTQKLRRHQP